MNLHRHQDRHAWSGNSKNNHYLRKSILFLLDMPLKITNLQVIIHIFSYISSNLNTYGLNIYSITRSGIIRLLWARTIISILIIKIRNLLNFTWWLVSQNVIFFRMLSYYNCNKISLYFCSFSMKPWRSLNNVGVFSITTFISLSLKVNSTLIGKSAIFFKHCSIWGFWRFFIGTTVLSQL